MGLGKSVITLTALWNLILDSFDLGRVLVVAPKRVAEDTWPKEIQKWDHLSGLSYSVVMGSEKQRRELCKSGRSCTSSTGRTWCGWWRTIAGTSMGW